MRRCARCERDFTVPTGIPSRSGGLLVGQAEIVGRPQDYLFIVWDLVEGEADLPRLPGRLERRREHGHLRLFVGCHVAALAPIQIDGDPAGDGVEPRSRLTVGIEPARGPPRLKKRLLDGFFGQAPVTEGSIRHREHGPPVGVIELTYGVGITAAETASSGVRS